jgi:hypothetical protein
LSKPKQDIDSNDAVSSLVDDNANDPSSMIGVGAILNNDDEFADYVQRDLDDETLVKTES